MIGPAHELKTTDQRLALNANAGGTHMTSSTSTHISGENEADKSDDRKRPLISFLLFAYNQERYIGAAVRAALSQTYSPLEIIISDDASTDRTFAIIEDEVAAYEGPHLVRVNRNDTNLGLGAHVNWMFGEAQGELFIMAGGDDISLPRRTESIYNAYVTSKEKVRALFSATVIIDSESVVHGILDDPPPKARADLQYMAVKMRPLVAGFAAAWHRSVYDYFGPMLPKTNYEDLALSLRAVILGKIEYLSEPLVLYRRHRNSITGQLRLSPDDRSRSITEMHARSVRELNSMITVRLGAQRDLCLAVACGHVEETLYLRLQQDAHWELALVVVKSRLLGLSGLSPTKALFLVARLSICLRYALQAFRTILPSILPLLGKLRDYRNLRRQIVQGGAWGDPLVVRCSSDPVLPSLIREINAIIQPDAISNAAILDSDGDEER